MEQKNSKVSNKKEVVKKNSKTVKTSNQKQTTKKKSSVKSTAKNQIKSKSNDNAKAVKKEVNKPIFDYEKQDLKEETSIKENDNFNSVENAFKTEKIEPKKIEVSKNKKSMKKQKKKIQKALLKEIQQNKKVYIKSCVVIVAIVVATIFLLNFKASRAVDTSTLLSDQIVDNLKFMNASLENNKLTVVVHNTLDDGYSLSTIDVTFQDENYNEITTVKGYIGNSLEKKDMKQLVVSTDVDLSSTVHIKYTINK